MGAGEVWYEFSDTPPAIERGTRSVMLRQPGARRKRTQLTSIRSRRLH